MAGLGFDGFDPLSPSVERKGKRKGQQQQQPLVPLFGSVMFVMSAIRAEAAV